MWIGPDLDTARAGTLLDRNAGPFDGEGADGRRALPPKVKGYQGEAALLQGLSRLLEAEAVERIVTFNGREYDLSVLIHRSVAAGVKPAAVLLRGQREKRYAPHAHVDLREQFGFFGAVRNGSLRAYALAYLGRDVKAGGGGDHVAELVAAGDAETLTSYCASDVRATAELYVRWRDLAGLAG